MLWGTLLLLRRSRRRRLLDSCATFPDRENNGCFLDTQPLSTLHPKISRICIFDTNTTKSCFYAFLILFRAEKILLISFYLFSYHKSVQLERI